MQVNVILDVVIVLLVPTLVNIHRTFRIDLHGSELWNIISKYTEEMHTT